MTMTQMQQMHKDKHGTGAGHTHQGMMGASARPPRDDLFRVLVPGDFQIWERELDDGSLATMVGHFLVFNEWTEIDSFFEGRFMERIAPGAAKKTLEEQGERIRVLFQHGRDPQIGSKVLGAPEVLREDEVGVWYEVPMLDTTYNRDLLPGLQTGQYGASFRFRVLREEIVDDPGRSDHNPNGIQERTIKEVQIMEFGPVTFPAYLGATAGVRSITDLFVFERLTHGEGLDRFLDYVRVYGNIDLKNMEEFQVPEEQEPTRTTLETDGPPEPAAVTLEKAVTTKRPPLRRTKPYWQLGR